MTDTSAILVRFMELLPESAASSLLTGMSTGQFDVPALELAFATVDWQLHRNTLEEMLGEFLPIEELIPDAYAKWRPVFRDGFDFIGARLSSDRLVPKLVEQLTFPRTTSAEDRILAFIRRVPILQKIGQTIARNTKLDASLRARLMTLEDEIHEVDESEIKTEVERQLGNRLTEYKVEIQPGIYGEGSVSALLRFTYKAPLGGEPATAVFKVLKPFIPEYFREDIALLAQLADYFDANQKRYNLGNLNLRALLDDVRTLYEREIDFINERESLVDAGWRYAGVPSIRIPRPNGALSTDTITAMTEERGVKITDAFPGNPMRRREVARRLIECLVARPLFSQQEISPFHADPHVGNLRVDESTGDIVLLDWALTGGLTTIDRRSLILLLIMLPLRDEGQILTALFGLSVTKDEATQTFFKRNIENFMDALPLGAVPNPGSLSDLVDSLLSAGARFSGSFLIFRKMLLTLEDVIEQIAPGEKIQQVVWEYALRGGLLNICFPGLQKPEFKVPLKSSDIFQLGLSAQFFLPRLWIQSLRRVTRSAEMSPDIVKT